MKERLIQKCKDNLSTKALSECGGSAGSLTSWDTQSPRLVPLELLLLGSQLCPLLTRQRGRTNSFSVTHVKRQGWSLWISASPWPRSGCCHLYTGLQTTTTTITTFSLSHQLFLEITQPFPIFHVLETLIF